MISSAQTLDTVRRAVRSVVEKTPELRGRPELQRVIASRMVDVSMAAAELLAEEQRLSEEIARRPKKQRRRAAGPAPMATAQTASDIHGMSATRGASDVLRATREAIDFPGFVTNLITGVFQAIQTSNIQQLEAFSELLQAVGGSTDDFATSQISDARAAGWAASRFGVFNVGRDGDQVVLELKDDAELPEPEVFQRLLDATQDDVDTIDDTDLVETLLPLVRRKLARDRQSMLSTMMLMGLQRIVVDDGSLHASMRLQVDARSTAERREAEQFDSRVETEASASFGMGAWGASAKMSASVGYVQSDEQFTREDIGVSAGLRSSVDLRFRSLPLDLTRMASDRQLQGLRDQSMVPATENEIGPGGLLSQQNAATRQPTMPTPAGPGIISQDGGTDDMLRQAREQAQEREQREEQRREQERRAGQEGGTQQADQPAAREGQTPPGGAGQTPPGGAGQTERPDASAGEGDQGGQERPAARTETPEAGAREQPTPPPDAAAGQPGRTAAEGEAPAAGGQGLAAAGSYASRPHRWRGVSPPHRLDHQTNRARRSSQS